jgi:hypothetical protein
VRSFAIAAYVIDSARAARGVPRVRLGALLERGQDRRELVLESRSPTVRPRRSPSVISGWKPQL